MSLFLSFFLSFSYHGRGGVEMMGPGLSGLLMGTVMSTST